MKSEFADAVATRLHWLHQSKNIRTDSAWYKEYHDAPLAAYARTLNTGDIFVANKYFCRLVEHAMKEVPDNLVFDAKWLQSLTGWCYLDQRASLPRVKGHEGLVGKAKYWDRGLLNFRAFGWYPSQSSGWQITGYMESPQGEFMPLFYWSLKDGHILGERIIAQEKLTPEYSQYENQDNHEVRYIFTALYLMAQRLTTIVHRQPDRATRRRAERMKESLPPLIKVVTLRRLESDRKADTTRDVDWHWQWEVRGHWRNQYYPSESIHKPVFVESYVKGPSDKPFKPNSLKLFSVSR